MSLHSQGLQLLKSNCIQTNQAQHKQQTENNENYIDLTELNTIDLNSTLEIKIDLKSNQISASTNTPNKLNVDSGCGTVLTSSDNKSNATLIQVNPIRSNMHSSRSYDDYTNNNYYYYDYQDEIFSNSNKIKIDIVSNNNSGYCVDSVEPKCNELKRLIEDFKIKYSNKIKLINDNRLLTEKLNIVTKSSLSLCVCQVININISEYLSKKKCN